MEKKPITSKLLKELKFKKTHVPIEVSGDDKPFDYWVLDLSKSNLGFCLITNSSDEVKNDQWKVNLFETEEYVFTDGDKLTEFIVEMKNALK